MLKYWRGGGGANPAPATTTIIADSSPSETSDNNDDEGPFFDLEFALPDDEDEDDDEQPEQEEEDNDDVDDAGSGSEEGTDGEREFDFTLSATAAEARTDPNLALSPSDDLFFKGRLVPLEPPATLHSESNSKSPFPASFLKSATKFRVSRLGFKRPKSVPENDGGDGLPPSAQKHQQQRSKSFTVKFNVEEVPIVSLFTRDYSSRSASGGKPQKLDDIISDDGVSASDMKRFSKDVLQKYFKMIKPLYIRVSKRYGDKLKFPGQLSLGTVKAATQEVSAVREADSASTTATGKNQKQVNRIPSGLRVVRKHLGKSRSASAAVAAAPPGTSECRKRDDSLLQQQDGIQSAILHCKRSLNPSNDQEQGSLSLPLSTSSPHVTSP
ncbi:probable membrane-associated kinase regulator 2 [Aristolochia californica]|uniref:probable membrane-associated kinase regulator 2 n=1 Tax=Aristolochia californica TaxID=171875 RepID=UPI0035DEEEC2